MLPAVNQPPIAIETPVRAASAAADVRLISLVCVGHCLSHFYSLVLPPLFPVLRAQLGACRRNHGRSKQWDGHPMRGAVSRPFRCGGRRESPSSGMRRTSNDRACHFSDRLLGVSYAALGGLITAYAGASAISQLVSGFLVDRLGPRRVLAGGLALLGSAMTLAGMAPTYGALIAIMPLAGLGNGVFHPADYSIFNTRVDPRRLGRAYSAHSSSGSLGWVLAPVVVGALTAAFGWRVAVTSVGTVGVVAALVILRQPVLGELARPAAPRPARAGAGLVAEIRPLLTPTILTAFAYFALIAASMSAVQNFAVAMMAAVYQAPLALATGALTAYMLGSGVGIISGGFLADRMRRHDLFASAGMAMAATLTLVFASGVPPAAGLAVLLAAIGFAQGATNPSRDLLVRAATPRGASGKTFGFVYSGLDLGTLAMPPIYGSLIDRGEPRAVFVVAAVLMALTILTVLEVGRRGAAARAAAYP
jgi:FSR family fosmidomycin resistance protein-like MFS transporter